MSYLARIEQHRDAIAELVKKRGAANPRLFGSALQEREGPDSDIDILVDALPGATLFDLGALQVELEELLGVPVDLLTPGDISPDFRGRVLRQAQPL
ncbi:nucleotidyltransferase family protein [Novosphingobium sp.]|uniref:nucleotidyltransferase family protein n=1 Tax=Novosphingobium sp. TaxID=1874826 RepID=UPI0025F95E4A|nr:nucleotidyltransferase family protein [Novosphingobium sp.]MCC6924304.1 nucleotidyltransferase family protein [Novosphingobium sp.]